MIRIEVNKSGTSIRSISLKGHASYAKEGEDLVCAGVSSVFSGALNALQEKDSFNFVYEKGDGLIEAKEETNSHEQIVLEVLVSQLSYIASYYPKNVIVIYN